MVFNSFGDILRVIVGGIVIYAFLVLLLRISGKRTLSKMNAFDLIVTVSLGSTAASTILSENVALAEGGTALAILVAMQYLVAWLSVRSQSFRGLVKNEPTLLLRDGNLLSNALRKERVTGEEVRAAIRDAGIAQVEDVGAVILETDGTLSVLSHSKGTPTAVTADVGNAAKV